MRRRTLRDAVVMPWRNGRGTTLELASDAEEDPMKVGAWTWRLSIADVASSGPFSRFEGCDRYIAVISGWGSPGSSMRLSIDGTVVDVPREGPMLAFPGEAEVEGLLDRDDEGREHPVRDANVMVRRDRWRARCRVVAIDAEGERCEGDIVLLHVLAGSAIVGAAGVPFDTADTCIAEGATVVRAATPGCRVIAAELTRYSASRTSERSPSSE
jgi:environmental stress-induced protein Ves